MMKCLSILLAAVVLLQVPSTPVTCRLHPVPEPANQPILTLPSSVPRASFCFHSLHLCRVSPSQLAMVRHRQLVSAGILLLQLWSKAA